MDHSDADIIDLINKNRTETNAKEGNIDEQFNLAFRYLLGESCEPDSNKAREWFEAAANQGDAEVQHYLASWLKAKLVKIL